MKSRKDNLIRFLAGTDSVSLPKDGDAELDVLRVPEKSFATSDGRRAPAGKGL